MIFFSFKSEYPILSERITIIFGRYAKRFTLNVVASVAKEYLLIILIFICFSLVSCPLIFVSAKYLIKNTPIKILT